MIDIDKELVAMREGWVPQDFSKRLEITDCKRIAIASDVHLPYHDEELVSRFLETALATHCDAIVWLGDLMDMPTHSSWGTDDFTTIFSREMRMTKRLIELAATVVDRQYWSSGNHEDRFSRRLGNQTGMEALANMVGLTALLADGRLIVSDHPSLLYRSKKDWLLTHPAQYSSTPLSLPGELADLEGMNVAAGHAHHWAKGSSKSGLYEVVETGGLFEPKHVKYVQQRVTKHRKWCKGFLILDHGESHLVKG